MKTNLICAKWKVLLCAALMIGLAACSSDDDPGKPAPKPKEEVLAFIRTKLIGENGNVLANTKENYGPGEYNLVADEEDETRDYFTQMTGIEIPSKDSYQCEYVSADGTCRISIEGSRQPVNGTYATLFFSVPEIPQIEILHIIEIGSI